jgi:hypothetical protein
MTSCELYLLFIMSIWVGPVRACKVWVRVGLYTAGSGFCEPGLACWAGSGSGLWA